jgi:hypothetical protein
MRVAPILVIALLVANGLTLATWQGWLPLTDPRREPQRVENQLNPEKIRLLSEPSTVTAPLPEPPAATLPATNTASPAPTAPVPVAAVEPQPAPVPAAPPAAVPSKAATKEKEPKEPPQGCLALDDLTPKQSQEISSFLAKKFSSLKISEEDSQSPTGWWVIVPPLSSRTAAEKVAAEIKARGEENFFIVNDAGSYRNAISMGFFRSESSARQHQSQLAAKGIKEVTVKPRYNNRRLAISGSKEQLNKAIPQLEKQVPVRIQNCGKE